MRASYLALFTVKVLNRGETKGLATLLFGFLALALLPVFITTIVRC